MALEYQKAIVLLVANKLYGSALALARLIFEAYARGIWLQMYASETEIEKFKKDELKKSLIRLSAKLSTAKVAY